MYIKKIVAVVSFFFCLLKTGEMLQAFSLELWRESLLLFAGLNVLSLIFFFWHGFFPLIIIWTWPWYILYLQNIQCRDFSRRSDCWPATRAHYSEIYICSAKGHFCFSWALSAMHFCPMQVGKEETRLWMILHWLLKHVNGQILGSTFLWLD